MVDNQYFKLCFEVDDYGQGYKQKWEGAKLERVLTDFVEFCNLKCCAKFVLVTGKVDKSQITIIVKEAKKCKDLKKKKRKHSAKAVV